MKLSPIFALLALNAPIIAHAQPPMRPPWLLLPPLLLALMRPADNAPSAAAIAPLPLAPKSAATADAFVWRFEPPVGSHWTMHSFTQATSVSQTPAMGAQKAASVQFKMMQKMTADYDILSRDALGATTIRMTLREMTNYIDLTSDGKALPSPFNKKADPKAVDGATLTIKQSRDGKTWGVVGMRAFQRKFLEASGMADKATIDQVLDASPMMGKDNKMMKAFSMMSGALPASPIRVGESWTYDVSLPAPLSLDISGTRTLKNLDSGFAVVADSARYEGGKSQMKMPDMPGMNGASVDYSKLIGAVNGTSRVQRSSGLPLETTMMQTIKGSISTQMPAANGAPAQKITVPLNVTSSLRMVLEPR